MHNSIAENVFGTIGTICWTGQLVPQVWKSYRSKSTTGLSHWLLLLWGISAVFQGLYVLLQKLNIPLMVQPQIFGFLSFLSWGQCQYYGLKRSLQTSVILTVFTMVLSGVVELVLVIAIRPSHNRGKHTAADFFGIFSSVLVSVALFPQYWEIYKRKEVIGISMLFIVIDILGGVFNLLSLAFKKEFDKIAAVTYASVVVLDSVIVVAALILNPMARKRRQREAEERGVIEVSQLSHGQPRVPLVQGSRCDTLPISIPPTTVEAGKHHYTDKVGYHLRDVIVNPPVYTERDEGHRRDLQDSEEGNPLDNPPHYERTYQGGDPDISLPPPVTWNQS